MRSDSRTLLMLLVVVSVLGFGAFGSSNALARGLPTLSPASDMQRAPFGSLHPVDGFGTHIVGGATAAPGQFPYAAFLQADYMVGGTPVTFFCTGSLITPTVVMTAAHCAYDEETGQLLQGSFFRVGLAFTQFPVAASNRRDGVALIPYPYYDAARHRGDVALLTLSAPAPAGAVPIALASSANASLFAAGTPAVVLGWGLTSNAPGAVGSDTLQWGTVNVQSNQTCAASGFTFVPSFSMCTQAPGGLPSSCTGDSGGPLVASTPAGPVAIGITSYGSATCGASPDFLVRTSSIQTWVASVLGGTPPPPLFAPPFNAPAPTAALNADGLTGTFAAPIADPATIPSGYSAALVNSAGATLATQNLSPGATTVSFPSLQPGTYGISVAAIYSEGSSPYVPSAPVTLNPPTNTKKPSITGPGIVGTTLTCNTGTWAWPGLSTLEVAWLRNGTSTGQATAIYRVGSNDAGKRLSCQVTLRATTGSSANATSANVTARAKLTARSAPHITGRARVGSRLTCSAGKWTHTGALKLRYTWLRNAKPIGAKLRKSAKRTVTAADAGRRLSCRVTASTTGQVKSKTTRAVTITAAA